MKPKALLIIWLVLVLHISNAQEAAILPESKSNGEQLVQDVPEILAQSFWSESVQDEFKIFISLPRNYDAARSEKYPVVYFLDGGGATFHTITAEYMQLRMIPEVITIGIGYPATSQRNRDYTYGFLNFYQFLKQELIPQMDEAYHIDPMKRTLFGHSYGGICVLFTMFQYFEYEDILFHNLIAASPSIWWPDGSLCFSRENNLYFRTSILPVNLYMTVGSLEGSMVDDFNNLEEVLESRGYEYFNSSYHVNSDKDHSTNKELSFREGIRWVLYQDIQDPDQLNSITRVNNGPKLIAFPNPVHDILKVSFENWNSANCKIELVNSSGRVAFQKATSNPAFEIDVSRFPKGFYLLKIEGEAIHSYSKIVVN